MMKKILKKVLLVSLLFSAAMPSAVQAGIFSNWGSWRNETVKVGSKAVNWLNTNGGNAFGFLQRHPITVGIRILPAANFLVWRKFIIKYLDCMIVRARAQMFFKYRIKVNLQDCDTDKVISLAKKYGNLGKFFHTLLEYDTKVNLQNFDADKALIFAIKNRLPDIVQMLFDYKANDIHIDLQHEIYRDWGGQENNTTLMLFRHIYSVD